MPPLRGAIKVEKWMEIYIPYTNIANPSPWSNGKIMTIFWKYSFHFRTMDSIISDNLYDEWKMKVFFHFLSWWPPLVSLQQVASWQRSPHPPHPVTVASRETVLRLRLPTVTHRTLTSGLGAQCTNVFLDAVVSLVLTHVSNRWAGRLTHSQKSSLLIGCRRHASFLLVEAILIEVEHSRRF